MTASWRQLCVTEYFFFYTLQDVIRMSNQEVEVSGTCSRHEIILKNLQT